MSSAIVTAFRREPRLGKITLGLLLALIILVPIGNLLIPAGSALHVSTYTVTLLGKYLCYALLALALDLAWGYLGILSLGHGAFFALGGYAMGMYLMREIGTRGAYGNANLPDFMVFLNWSELPWFWLGSEYFIWALVMMLFVPGLLAFVLGWLCFRSRVSGVYLSIITQAMTYALMLAFYRNEMGFGGNNGLTDFKDVLGFSLTADTTRVALFAITGLTVLAVWPAAQHHGFPLGQARGGGARCRNARALCRLSGGTHQAGHFRALGHDCRCGRCALCAASGHHQPERIRAARFN